MPEKITRLSLTLSMLCVSIALANCKAVEKKTQDKAAFETIVKARLGEKYHIEYNNTKTYALCQQQREGDHSQRNFKYVVVRISNNQVVREGSFKNGHAKWSDDKSIEVLSSSSIRDDGGNTKIIQIDSNQR